MYGLEVGQTEEGQMKVVKKSQELSQLLATSGGHFEKAFVFKNYWMQSIKSSFFLLNIA